MTKAEAAVIMAYTGYTMLQGKDIPMYLAYVKAITGVEFTIEDIQVYDTDDTKTRRQKRKIQKIIKDGARGDFLNICSNLNYGYVFRRGKPAAARILRSLRPEE